MKMQIEDQLQHPTKRSDSLTPMNQLLIGLRFYATGSFQLVIGDTFAVNNATVCRTLKRVTHAIAGLRGKYVRLPETVEERRTNMQLFSRSQLPGLIGAVDGTHTVSGHRRGRNTYHLPNLCILLDHSM